jgi:hypothetical protein
VKGNGAYVAVTSGNGLLSGGYGPVLAVLKCDMASRVTLAKTSLGVRCYRRVRWLKNWRPITVAQQRAWTACNKAMATRDRTWAMYVKVMDVYDRIWAMHDKKTNAYYKAWTACDKARAVYHKARTAYIMAGTSLLATLNSTKRG